MAELDLYGDLYGDVDDPGSPVELSPRPLPPIDDQPPVSDIKPVVSSDSVKGESNGPQPTTFSISTYEENYTNKKSDPSQQTGTESGWQAPSSRLPLSPTLQSPSAESGGRPGLWGVKPSDMPDEGKMFVGGLNWETSEDALKQYFTQFGAVVHCTIMRDPTNGRSRGFAFLTFADPAVVNKVMVKEHFLDGKLIDPKRAIPRGSGPLPSGLPTSSVVDKRHSGSESAASLSNKLFCRGMPEDATPQSFRTYWAQYGNQVNIEEAVLMMDRDTNRHRGFGFINLVTGDDADQLLKCGPFVMDGLPLEVKKKAPSRARYEGRDDMSKMTSSHDRYGGYSGSGHHDSPSYGQSSMSGFYKNSMSNPSWKSWNPSMVQPMGGGMAHSRGSYMGGMGMHDDRGSRGMAYDGPGGMGGGYSGGGGYHRSNNSAYAPDWRAGPSSMRSGPPSSYSNSYHHHNAPPPPALGPNRSQRSSRNYAPY